jgi:hypothetical protein
VPESAFQVVHFLLIGTRLHVIEVELLAVATWSFFNSLALSNIDIQVHILFEVGKNITGSFVLARFSFEVLRQTSIQINFTFDFEINFKVALNFDKA